MTNAILHKTHRLDLQFIWLLEDLVYHLPTVEHILTFSTGNSACVSAAQATGASVLNTNAQQHRFLPEFDWCEISYCNGSINRINSAALANKDLELSLYSAVSDMVFRAIPFKNTNPNIIGVFGDAQDHQSDGDLFNIPLHGVGKIDSYEIIKMLLRSNYTVITNNLLCKDLKHIYKKQLITTASPIKIFKSLFNMAAIISTDSFCSRFVTRGAALNIPVIVTSDIDVAYIKNYVLHADTCQQVMGHIQSIQAGAVMLDDIVHMARVVAWQHGMRSIINEVKRHIRAYGTT